MTKPWLKQPGECHDSRGIPIYPGDLLRTPHFRGRRRKQYYLYHVATFDQDAGAMRMVPTCHLDPALRDSPDHRGGNPLLCDDLAAEATVIEGCSTDGLMYDERPRKTKDEPRDHHS